jgi:hypothetical protein
MNLYLTVTPTSSATATNTSSPLPAPLQPAANQAQASSEQRNLAIGFGVTTALLVTGGILVGFFARQAAFNIYMWIKTKVSPPSKPKPHAVSTRIPLDSHVIHLNMNPAMIHQQTTMEILNLARQQRLEAIQAQQQATQGEDQSLSRLKSFKKTYQPIKSPGSSV